MTKKSLVLTDPAEAAVVNEIVVRLVGPEEVWEWDRLMIQHHYLKSALLAFLFFKYTCASSTTMT